MADTGSNYDAAFIVAGAGLAAGLVILTIVFWRRRREVSEK